MRLEFIPEGAVDAPLLLLADITREGAQRLSAAFESLAAGETDAVAVESLMDGPGAISLRAVVSRRDRGVEPLSAGSPSFVCALDAEGWREVVDMLAPFRDEPDEARFFQYLTRAGRVAWIASRDGSW